MSSNYMPVLPYSDGSLHSTLDLLDSLEVFYHNQRDWIEQTRSALDQAFEQSHHKCDYPSLPSPPTSGSESGSSTADERGASLSPSLARKKKGMKLSLDLQSSRSPPPYIRPITSRRDLDQRKRMLDMLDEMMQARMDSCKFANRLVRNTHRTGSYRR